MINTLGMSEKHERLKEARLAAGYESASAAARAHGWKPSKYIAHENSQNDFSAEQAQEYARVFQTTAEWLLWGETASDRLIAQLQKINAEMRALPTEDSEKLISDFNNMIRGVKVIRGIK